MACRIIVLPTTILVLAAALAACGDDKAPAATKSEASDKPTTKPASTTSANRDACIRLRARAGDGDVTVTHLAGTDNLGFDATDGKAKLSAGSSQTGSTTRISMRGGHDTVNVSGRPTCLATSKLVLEFSGPAPEVGKQVRYAWKYGHTEQLLRRQGIRFYIDINEKKSVASIGTPTIEYSGTEGSYTFTKLNEKRDDDPKAGYHTIKFDLEFQKITAGQLDPAVKTRLSGQFTFNTMRPL